MKKLVVGSFAFVLALMLTTSVYAVDIMEYNGENGLVDRIVPISNGDVLNIKQNITQSSGTYNDILSKSITINGDQDPQAGTADNGGRVNVDGGGYSGFYMESGSSTMNNLDLTGYNNILFSIYDNAKLTLNDVNIYGNDGAPIRLEGGAELNIVSKNEDVNISNNAYFSMTNATLNFKGNKIVVDSDGVFVTSSTINNSADLSFKYSENQLYGNSKFNNTGTFTAEGIDLYVYNKSSINNSGTFNNNQGYIGVYNNGIFNNSGTVNNAGMIELGYGGIYYAQPLFAGDGEYEEEHPTFNNNGILNSTGTISVGENAIFNNNKKVVNGIGNEHGTIVVSDLGTFNNKGELINNGDLYVYGEFNNKGTVNSSSNSFIYVGKQSGPNGPVITDLPPNVSRSRAVLVLPAVFNNDGKVISESEIVVDQNGIFNNNGTLISKDSASEDSEPSFSIIRIAGEVHNNGLIDAARIQFGSGQRVAPSNDDTMLRVQLPGWMYPVLANYEKKTINISEGIVGDGYIYNAGTINLGGEYNGMFSGGVTVDGGTINLLKDSNYFNRAQYHEYMNGTLNLVNGTMDEVCMNELYVDGTMKVNFDIDLNPESKDDGEDEGGDDFSPAKEESEANYGLGDYLDIGTVYTPKEEGDDEEEDDDDEYIKVASMASKTDIYTPTRGTPRILVNDLKILKDSKEKETKVEIATPEAQEYIRLGKKKALGVMFVYDVSISSSDVKKDNSLSKASNDPTTGESIDEGPQGEYGNILTFKRRGDISSLDSGERMKGEVHPGLAQGGVAAAGASISQEEIFDTVLNNAGNYSFFQKQGSNAGDVEDRAAPTLWVKAFGSQEDVDMEDYTKVKTTYYGAMVGLDWDRQYSDNFDATYGLFASYIGGELKDDNWEEGDYKVKQNGGYIGLRGNWYFGKLFVNGIVDYGMISNGADNPYDSSDFNSSVIGLAARVGYNFEVANRRFTIQPGVGVTGKYIISDDFETTLSDDSKIKEEIDNITNITVEPGLKLALNLGRCWILTGEGKYVIENYDGDMKVKGEDLDFVLPEMSYKNYTSCGLGIEKIWGYTVLHLKGNKTFGGRDGFIVNAGIEFKF